ncbi:MAG: STAS domain-containing protein [Proteobacteria bacterium]|nr:STAS domain-containing protein [Pseudomonadota bacterium]MBU0968934.1 STAS domain-containing protein [Pseudomonadota bacterium]
MSHIERKNGVVIIKPGIDIVASQCANLKLEFLEIINNSEKKIVIDFSGTEMIDSSGIGLLISIRNSLANYGGGEIELLNLSEDLKQLFKVMKLDNHFKIS